MRRRRGRFIADRFHGEGRTLAGGSAHRTRGTPHADGPRALGGPGRWGSRAFNGLNHLTRWYSSERIGGSVGRRGPRQPDGAAGNGASQSAERHWGVSSGPRCPPPTPYVLMWAAAILRRRPAKCAPRRPRKRVRKSIRGTRSVCGVYVQRGGTRGPEGGEGRSGGRRRRRGCGR